ncbi:phosphatidate cytidylyltransferase [Hymenobacter koreensis]|uniref:phosphatidate cytidylyltransferase n=1 Tax=Hymenobacter koreensis TaxID=1084523 RepID=UPI0031EABFF9
MASPSTPPPATNSPDVAKPAMSNMWQRILSGVVGAALLLGSIWYSEWTFGLLFGLIQALMLREFYRMMKELGFKPAAIVGISLSLIIFAAAFVYALVSNLLDIAQATDRLFVQELSHYLKWVRIEVVVIAFLLPLILFLREMYSWPREKQPFSPFPNVGVALIGLFYVTLPMSGLNMLAFGPTGYDYRRIFALLFLIWAADTGAYIAGKNFGKHKLAPSISPGKTWEGWAGGALLTLAVGWALGYLLPDMPLAHRLVAAAVVAVFGPLGDLAESMLKRSTGVKDSGRIMPGHGGLLDRFDAFLFVVPVLVVLQLLFT